MLGSSSAWKTLLPLGLLLSFFLTGCEVFKDAHQTTFDARGPVAREQLNLFMLSLWVITFIFIAVASALLYTVIRFRWRPGQREEDIPKQTHGNPLIEISLIVASVILLVILAVPTVRVAVFSYDVPPELEGDVLEVTAIGFQWWWQFEYPEEGIITANELVIPVDRPIRINVRTEDVVHSFWVPKLGGKRDMIPNRSNFLWLMADEVGEYYGQCAEFCGTSHANMLFRVHAVSEEDYNNWLAMKRRPSPAPADPRAIEGQRLFQARGCMQCHNIDGAGGIDGPSLSHFATRGTVAAGLMDNTIPNVVLWLRETDRVKPGNLMTEAVAPLNMPEAELESIAAYLHSLN